MAEPRMRLHHEPETTAQALFERARRLDQVAGFGYEMADFLTDLVPFLEAIASLPQQTAEPVAWRFKSNDPNYDDTYVYCATEKMALLRCPKNSEVEPLYTHPASPPVGGAVKCKPLEWKKRDPSGGIWRAETILGAYRVWTHAEAQSRWFWSGGVGKEGSASTVDAAKAAAQADFEQRILSALEPPASDRGAEANGLERAAKWHDQRARDTPDAFETEFHQVSAAAIRKLSEVSQ